MPVGDFSLSDAAEARHGAQDDAEAQEARLILKVTDKIAAVFSAKFDTLANSVSDKIHEALDAERGASRVSPRGDARRGVGAFSDKIHEALDAERGASRVNPSGDARRGVGHGRQADLPTLVGDGGDDDDVASSALSGNSTAPGGDSSSESDKLWRIVGEPDPDYAYEPYKQYLSPAWRQACSKQGKSGLSKDDIPEVAALCAAARALLSAEALLADFSSESEEQLQDIDYVSATIADATKCLHLRLNTLAVRECLPPADAKIVDQAARAKASGIYTGEGGIPITDKHFNEILLEVQQKQAKNSLKKLHGGDTKKTKIDDDDEDAGPKKDKRADAGKHTQRKLQEALQQIRRSEPD